MSDILDWILILFGTICALISFHSIIENKNSSVSHFIILVEYIICCLPVLCNYIFGYPEYITVYWYSVFRSSMHNASVAIMYDIYILFSMLILEAYAVSYDRRHPDKMERKKLQINSLLQNKLILTLCILSPFIYIIISGHLSYFLVYGVRTTRYASENSMSRVVSMLILLSIYSFFFYLFTTKKTWIKSILTLVYIFLISWLQGKRFILVIIGLVYLFYYTKQGLDQKQKQRLRRTIPVLAIAILAFSYAYLVFIRPMSDTSFRSIYEMLRVDFGRDDVIKYVIEKTILDHEKIVPYAGSTFLSTFLFFIPRTLWPTKPYPHYVYLTANILNVSIMSIPAGTTPSWFEMCIANFGIAGFLIGILSIPLLCRAIDRLRETLYQLIALVLVCAFLTQNIDAYTMFVLIFVLQFVIRRIVNRRPLTIMFGKRKVLQLGNMQLEDDT